MTYIAQYFHAFFSSIIKPEVEARRVANFVENLKSIWTSMNDYERRVTELMEEIRSTIGITLDLESFWKELLVTEAQTITINQRKHSRRMPLKHELHQYALELAALTGPLDEQLARKLKRSKIPWEKSSRPLCLELKQAELDCLEANVEENDYAVYTADDLNSKPMKIISSGMTKLTPAQIEEFETTFRYFDKDEENKLGLPGFSAALVV
ncbi:hypothetical protein Pst134EA_032945 [Puccinia striiformis f. sp. tritici]|uniref:uncharacterized protein n=1 Tax=Puccinia striiformis f. sp. tritici TaxID=168172 RepID=UPI0020081104|nr:uncharacterized protein Pst134EA_032945 [Puccinia striiformis f. sp. tritici]KAH9441510.1 hypothetical protein Pst134EA_032945 [Puccinia striiformis f. sp. tritici]